MNLSYETAKKLKDAGFPQLGTFMETKVEDGVLKGCTGNGSWEEEDCGKRDADGDCECDSHEQTYIPTLSELIEACGREFGTLAQYKFPGTDGMLWRAAQMPHGSQEGEGSTPEEAVAALYLALKK